MDQLKMIRELFPEAPEVVVEDMLAFGGIGDFSKEELAFLKACKNADYERVKEGLKKNKDKFGKLHLWDGRNTLNLLMENFRNLKPGAHASDCVKLLVEANSTEIYDTLFNPLEDSYLVSVSHPFDPVPFVLDDRINDEKLRLEYVKVCEYLIKRGCIISPSNTVTFLRANDVSDQQIMEWQKVGNSYRDKKQEEYEKAHPEEAKKERERRVSTSHVLRKIERKRLQELRQKCRNRLSLLGEDMSQKKRQKLMGEILDYKRRIAKIEDELSVGEPAVQERLDKAKELKREMRNRDTTDEKIPLRTFLKKKTEKEKVSIEKAKEME